MQLDVFTLVPHAYGWLTEQRPVATVPVLTILDCVYSKVLAQAAINGTGKASRHLMHRCWARVA